MCKNIRDLLKFFISISYKILKFGASSVNQKHTRPTRQARVFFLCTESFRTEFKCARSQNSSRCVLWRISRKLFTVPNQCIDHDVSSSPLHALETTITCLCYLEEGMTWKPCAHVEVRGQLEGLVMSFHHGVQELNSDHQAWSKAPYPSVFVC